MPSRPPPGPPGRAGPPGAPEPRRPPPAPAADHPRPTSPSPPPDDSPTLELPRAPGGLPQSSDLSATGGHLVPRAQSTRARGTRRQRTREEWLEVIRTRARNQAPLLVVWGVLLLAFVRIALQHWREGTTELGVALLLAAVFRWRCSDDRVGLLAIRARRVDIVTYTVFGLIMILLSLTITGGPLASR